MRVKVHVYVRVSCQQATSNICTSAGLCALAFSIHATLLGEEGLRTMALLNHSKACELADMISKVCVAIPAAIPQQLCCFSRCLSVLCPPTYSPCVIRFSDRADGGNRQSDLL